MVVYASLALLIASIAALFVGVATNRHGFALLAFVGVCAGFGLPPILNQVSKQDEIDAGQYDAMSRMQEQDPSLAPSISAAMRDGRVDGLEYEDVTHAFDRDMRERERGQLSRKARTPTPDELRREARERLLYEAQESQGEIDMRDKEIAK
jgi:hypothetical protein